MEIFGGYMPVTEKMEAFGRPRCPQFSKQYFCIKFQCHRVKMFPSHFSISYILFQSSHFFHSLKFFILLVIMLQVSAYLFPVSTICNLARARSIHFTDSHLHAHARPLRPVSLSLSMTGSGLASYPKERMLLLFIHFL